MGLDEMMISSDENRLILVRRLQMQERNGYVKINFKRATLLQKLYFP